MSLVRLPFYRRHLRRMLLSLPSLSQPISYDTCVCVCCVLCVYKYIFFPNLSLRLNVCRKYPVLYVTYDMKLLRLQSMDVKRRAREWEQAEIPEKYTIQAFQAEIASSVVSSALSETDRRMLLLLLLLLLQYGQRNRCVNHYIMFSYFVLRFIGLLLLLPLLLLLLLKAK